MSDILAEFKIFFSNFNARFGTLVNIILWLAVLALVLSVFIRAIAAGYARRKKTPVKVRRPDDSTCEHACESLSQAIRIATVTGSAAELERLYELLKRSYPRVFSTLGVLHLPSGSILMRWKASERTEQLPVMFCAHLDVAPAGDGWNEDPFGGMRRDGRIYGRGAVDCKGTVIALLEAVDMLLQEGFVPRRDIYFSFGHDEETGGFEGAAAISDLLTKRGLSFDMILDEGGCIVKEHLGDKGFPAALIALGEKLSCSFTLTSSAKGGSASAPPARSAFGVLAEAVCRLEAAHMRCRILPITHEYLRQSAPAMSFGKRLIAANMPIFNKFFPAAFKNNRRILALLRTTMITTSLSADNAESMLPYHARAVVNARLLPGDTPQSVLRHISELLSDLPVDVAMTHSDEKHVPITPTSHPMYQLLCRTLTEQYPSLTCVPTLTTESTDSRHYRHLSDCVIRFRPFFEDNDDTPPHAANESVSELSLGAAVDLYAAFIKKL